MATLGTSAKEKKHENKCYTCVDNLNLKSATGTIECRRYDSIESNMIETLIQLSLSELRELGYIGSANAGVTPNGIELDFGMDFRFKPQSRGTRGLTAIQCGWHPQPVEMIQHKKVIKHERIYINWESCLRQVLGTTLQGKVYPAGRIEEGSEAMNDLTEELMDAARRDMAHNYDMSDLLGIFGHHMSERAHYDGTFAQAWYAYNNAYYHSMQYSIDTDVWTDGMVLHAKYGGDTKWFKLDSSLPSDASQYRFESRVEAVHALSVWLNSLRHNDQKLVDVTYNSSGSQVWATHKHTEGTIDLALEVNNGTVIDWTCATGAGVTYTQLQNSMPIDERPALVKYRNYNKHNVLEDLPCDISDAVNKMDRQLKRGYNFGLAIDPKIMEMYKAAALRDKCDPMALNSLYDIDEVDILDGTGYWFYTIKDSNESRRNIRHLTDQERTGLDPIFIGPKDNMCNNIVMNYDSLGGVAVWDFRLFASNLLCSPIASELEGREPHQPLLIPCLCEEAIKGCVKPTDDGCIEAGFMVSDVKQTADGKYQFTIMDTTTGISAMDNPSHNYLIQFDDGSQYEFNTANPTVTFDVWMFPMVFNVIQTVYKNAGDESCKDTFNYSKTQGDNITIKGDCSLIELSLDWDITKKEMTNQVEVCDYSFEKPIIDGDGFYINYSVDGTNKQLQIPAAIAAGDWAAVTAYINMFLGDNDYLGTASHDATTDVLTISGTNLVWLEFNHGCRASAPSNCTTMDNTFEKYVLTVKDRSDYDNDTLLESTFTLTTDCGTLVFDEIPYNEDVTDLITCTGSTATIKLEASLQTELGCSFDVVSEVAYDSNVNPTSSNLNRMSSSISEEGTIKK